MVIYVDIYIRTNYTRIQIQGDPYNVIQSFSVNFLYKNNLFNGKTRASRQARI